MSRRWRTGPGGGLGLLLSMVVGCDGGSPELADDTPTEQARPRRPLRVLVGGCAELPHPGSCEIPSAPGELTLWVDLDDHIETRAVVDGTPLSVPVERAVDGWRMSIPASTTMRTIEIEADLGDEVGLAHLDLIPPAAADDRGLASVEAHLLEGQAALLRGDLATMEVYWSWGTELAHTHGRWMLASRMAQSRAYYCLRALDPACADGWLSIDAGLGVHQTERGATRRYYDGMAAESRGDFQTAIVAYEEALHDALALGRDEVLEGGALVRLMLLVGRLGDHDRAQALLERALAVAPGLPDAVRAQVLNTAAWMLLESRVRSAAGLGREPANPVALLDEALSLLDGQPAAYDETRAVIRLNLAYEAIMRDDADAARRWLDAGAKDRLRPIEGQWRLLLLARLALLEGDVDGARRSFSTLVADAIRHGDVDLRWLAIVGQGQALEAAGAFDEALVAYTAADRVVDDQLPYLGLGDGRERFVAERDLGTQRRISLLMRQHRATEALCVARLARTRVMRAVAQAKRIDSAATEEERRALVDYRNTRSRIESEYAQARWEGYEAKARLRHRELLREREVNEGRLQALLTRLEPRIPEPSCSALSRPADGSLDLHYVALEDGWVVFVVDASGTVATESIVPPVSTHDAEPSWSSPQVRRTWGRALLGPIESRLEGIEHVRVMPWGALQSVPFHALVLDPHDEVVLLDTAAVEYGFDLPSKPSTTEQIATALIVAPPSNLPHADDELASGQAALRALGLHVDALEGDEANGAALRDALPRVGWLHYVGHAHSDGFSGWDSGLSLARGDVGDFTVGDVLASPRVPAAVLLNGCRTGSVDPQSLEGGMSLAHAFVLGGAQVVVATTRAVADDEAAGLMREFYRALPAADARLVPEALRAAQLAQRHGEAWLFVRAWVP